MKKMLKRITACIMVAVMMVTLLPNSLLNQFGLTDIGSSKAAVYKITKEQLFTLAPNYLNSGSDHEYFDKALSVANDAADTVTESDEVSAAIHMALNEGGSYLFNELAAKLNLTDSMSEKVKEEMARAVLHEYMGNKDYAAEALSEVAEDWEFVDKSFSASVDWTEETYVEVLSKNTRYTKDQLDDILGKNSIGKIMGYVDTADKAFKMLNDILMLEQIELDALDELISIYGKSEKEYYKDIHDGLVSIRYDVTSNLGEYIVANYCTDWALNKLYSVAEDGLFNAISGSASAVVKLVLAFENKKFEEKNPSVSEIMMIIFARSNTEKALNMVDDYRIGFYMKTYGADDIDEYEAAYRYYMSSLKVYLDKVQAAVKDDVETKDLLKSYEASINVSRTYKTYINQCLAEATKAIDAGTLKIDGQVVVITDKNGNVIDENYDSTESIAARLATIQAVYKPNVGQRWTASYQGCIQCCGFAKLVFNKLFGYDVSSYVGNKRYMLRNESNVIKVGQLVGDDVTLANVKALFANAKVGDYIQVNGSTYGQHSAIFAGLADNGIVVYDCNSKLNGTGDCLINQWTMTYNNLVSWYGNPSSASENGISVYRAKNYATIYGDGDDLFYDDTVNFVISDGVLTKYNGFATYVIIPDEVTAIGDNAFKNNTTLQYVEIPDTVTSIGNSAFYGCTELGSIYIPNSVESIGSSAFYGCTSLTSVHLPENEKFFELSNSLFYSCDSLNDVKIPENVIEIGDKAFYKCVDLSSFELPNKIESIGGDAFYYCISIEEISIPKSLEIADYDTYFNYGVFRDCSNLKNVYFEEGITTIPSGLFFGCTGLETIEIPGTVTKIGKHAFYNCVNLRTVGLPNSIITISDNAFYNCVSLSDIELPCSINYIGENAFYKCESLKEVNIPKSLETVGYDTYYSYGVFRDCSNLKNVYFEEGITTIPSGLFFGCTGLETIEIPGTVTKIGKYAFYNCVNLKTVGLPDSIITISDNAFYNCVSLSDIELPCSINYIGENAFYKCESLKEVNIPKSLETVGYDTYYSYGVFGDCSNLKNVYFEEGITKIIPGLFYRCTGLEEVEIPSSVTTIGEYAFYDCENLKFIFIPDSVVKLGDYVFEGCSSLSELKLPVKVNNIPKGMCQDCINLSAISFSGDINIINSSAFKNCESLSRITIPDSVTHIYGEAFYNCKSMQSVSMGSGVITIDSSVFYNNSSLTEVKLNEGLEIINGNAFAHCESLESITLPDSLTYLGTKAFAYCDKLFEVNLGAGITEIPTYCFYEDPALKSIVLPQQVTKVGEFAFGNCTAFENVTVNRNVTSMAANAFSYPAKLTMYGVKDTYAEEFAFDNDIAFVALSNPATDIKLSRTELTLGKYEEAKLTASITPIDSSDELTWTSTDENIVTVSDNGEIEALNVGEATIVAMAGDVIVTCDVTVYQAVSSVYIDYYELEGTIGDTFELEATVYPSDASNKNVIWSSEDENVATVDENGKVTAIGYGTTRIIATTEDKGMTDYCTVTISPVPVTGVSLNTTSITLVPGNECTLIPTVKPSNATNQEVIWSSSKAAVATVENGVVKAISEGTAIIIVKTKDGSKTASCTVTVKNASSIDTSVTGVMLDQLDVELEVYDSIQLYETVLPDGAENTDVMWSSDNPYVATVDQTGYVTAVSPGTANITVTTKEGGYTATCVITVLEDDDNTILVDRITVGKSNINLEVGESERITATVSPSDASNKNVKWTSNNTSVATVSSNGTITALKAGTATITVSSTDGSGVKATCVVTVTKKDEPITPPVTEEPDEPDEPIVPPMQDDKMEDVDVTYHTHIQSYGDSQGTKKNGEMAGTSGEAKRLENIWIDVEGNDNLGVQYSTHCQSYGWMPWSCDGETNGTSGEAKRLEAIKIQLTGADKDKYDIYYRVHAQSYGWLGWAKNGAPSGTAGYAKRLEGIQVVVVKKGEAGPGLNFAGVDGSSSKYSNQAYVDKNNAAIVIPGDVNAPIVSYKTHVQSFGWQKWVHNGAMSGTSGQAKRLEGINIKVTNCPYDGDIVYTTHVQTYGWQGKPDDATRTGWKKNGEMSGTSGKAKRLEAICIDLTGEMGEKYDIYYRVHAQSFGWLGWAKNGEESGTAGYAKRLEGIQIVLVPKGGAAPANSYGGVTSARTEAYIQK